MTEPDTAAHPESSMPCVVSGLCAIESHTWIAPCAKAPSAEEIEAALRPTTTAARCPSMIFCCEDGVLRCTEPIGHDPDFHRAPSHEWDDALAEEFARMDAEDA